MVIETEKNRTYFGHWTNDHRERRATKIQQAFKRHYYSPSNPRHAQRIEQGQNKLATLDDTKPSTSSGTR